MERQRGFYHKCHRCVFRGKAADFRLPPTNDRAGFVEMEDQRADAIAAHTNGVARTNGVAHTNGVANTNGAAHTNGVAPESGAAASEGA